MFLKGKTIEFYIDLQEHRYYAPGETVRGHVVLDLSKPTKIYHIRVALSGVVQVNNNSLTLFNRECQIAACPEEPGKAHLVEARNNRFPFELKIPGESAELPTSMKLSNGNGVKYMLSATLKVPYSILETFAPQDSREISIVEKIDVSLPEYSGNRGVDEYIQLEGEEDPRKVHVVVNVPKFAIVRGDILPVKVNVTHYKSFAKTNAIKILLIRRCSLYVNGRSQLFEQRPIKSTLIDLDVSREEDGFTQESVAKILIPQSAPPTTGQSGRILRVAYEVHVSVDLDLAVRSDPDWKQANSVTARIPIIIGTTPKVDICIDDDDEQQEEEAQEEAAVAEEFTSSTIEELKAAIDNFSLDDVSSNTNQASPPAQMGSGDLPHNNHSRSNSTSSQKNPCSLTLATTIPPGEQSSSPKEYSRPCTPASAPCYQNAYFDYYMGSYSPTGSSSGSPTIHSRSSSTRLLMPDKDDYIPKQQQRPKLSSARLEQTPAACNNNPTPVIPTHPNALPQMPFDYHHPPATPRAAVAMPVPSPVAHQSYSNPSSLSTSPAQYFPYSNGPSQLQDSGFNAGTPSTHHSPVVNIRPLGEDHLPYPPVGHNMPMSMPTPSVPIPTYSCPPVDIHHGTGHPPQPDHINPAHPMAPGASFPGYPPPPPPVYPHPLVSHNNNGSSNKYAPW